MYYVYFKSYCGFGLILQSIKYSHKCMKWKIFFELGKDLKLLFHPLTLCYVVIHPYHDTISLYEHIQHIWTQIVYYHAWFNIQWTAIWYTRPPPPIRCCRYHSVYLLVKCSWKYNTSIHIFLSMRSPDEWSSSTEHTEQHVSSIYNVYERKEKKHASKQAKQNEKENHIQFVFS